MIRTIAAREIRSMFLSPLAWVILAVVQFILAYIFLSRLQLFAEYQPRLMGVPGAPGLTDIVVAPLFGSAGIVLLMVAPLLTMRLLAEERRNGTLTLLLAAPVSMTEIVLGKFFGMLGFFAVLVALNVAMPLSLLLGGNLDMGQFGSGVFGLCLVLAAFTAIGLFLSSLTSYPTVAGVSTFGVLLLLWIIDWAAGSGSAATSGLFTYLSMVHHYQNLLKGIFSTQDVVYYLLVITTFVLLTIWRLDNDRLQR